MPDAIQLLNATMNADLIQLRSVSQNLANINTLGYKREVVSQAGFSAVMMRQAMTNPNVVGNGAIMSAGLPQPNITIERDTTQGTFKYTENIHDIAVSGDGFLVAQGETGLVYTRRGELALDGFGNLVLKSGETVMVSGDSISMEPGDFVINRIGEISQNEIVLGQLDVVSFGADSWPEYIGNGFYVTTGQPVQADMGAVKIMQGYVETSNVNSLTEMVKLIEITRHFETSHAILKGYDDMLDASINVLGDM